VPTYTLGGQLTAEFLTTKQNNISNYKIPFYQIFTAILRMSITENNLLTVFHTDSKIGHPFM